MKVSLKGMVSVLGAAAVSLCLAAPGSAEPDSGKGKEGKGGEETLEALLIVSLKRDLEMDTTQAVELAARVKPMLEARRDFAKQQARLRREMTENLESDAPDKAAIDRQIRQVFELRSALIKTQEQAFTELGAGMDPIERGRLFVSLERFEERVRRQLRRFQDGGKMRRGGGERDGDDEL